MINKKQTIQKGFTLIEVLVAVFILITAVVVPLTIGSKGIFYANVVRDQSIASYLAQEAMEYVRVVRDNAFLEESINAQSIASNAWSSFVNTISNCDVTGNTSAPGCVIDIERNIFEQCSSGCELWIDGNGKYTTEKSGGTEKSTFTRIIKTSQEGEFNTSNSSRTKVEVTVTWKTNSLERSVTITNYLTPWQL